MDKFEQKKILDGLVKYLESFSSDCLIAKYIDTEEQTHYSFFMYDEMLANYSPVMGYYEEKMAQLELADTQVANLKKFNRLLAQYANNSEDENLFAKEVKILKDPDWIKVQNEALNLLKSLKKNIQPLQVRIEASHLEDFSYCITQKNKLIEVLEEVITGSRYEQRWSKLDQNYQLGGFLNFYYQFSIKAKTILVYPESFHLTSSSIDLLADLLEKITHLYHEVVKEIIPTKKLLKHRGWHEIQKIAGNLVSELKTNR